MSERFVEVPKECNPEDFVRGAFNAMLDSDCPWVEVRCGLYGGVYVCTLRQFEFRCLDSKDSSCEEKR